MVSRRADSFQQLGELFLGEAGASVTRGRRQNRLEGPIHLKRIQLTIIG